MLNVDVLSMCIWPGYLGAGYGLTRMQVCCPQRRGTLAYGGWVQLVESQGINGMRVEYPCIALGC